MHARSVCTCSLKRRALGAFASAVVAARRDRAHARLAARLLLRVRRSHARRALLALRAHVASRLSLRYRLRGWYLLNAAWDAWVRRWSRATVAASAYVHIARLRAAQAAVAWRAVTVRRMRFLVMRWRRL